MRPGLRRLLEYARLERRRAFDGLSSGQIRRWIDLRNEMSRLFNASWEATPERRRDTVRIPTRLECSLQVGSASASGLITDLSLGGVFVHTREPPALGTPLVLRIEHETIGLEIEGRVVRTMAPVGVGIQFLSTSESVRRRLHDLYEGAIRNLQHPRRDLDSSVAGDAR